MACELISVPLKGSTPMKANMQPTATPASTGRRFKEDPKLVPACGPRKRCLLQTPERPGLFSLFRSKATTWWRLHVALALRMKFDGGLRRQWSVGPLRSYSRGYIRNEAPCGCQPFPSLNAVSRGEYFGETLTRIMAYRAQKTPIWFSMQGACTDPWPPSRQ